VLLIPDKSLFITEDQRRYYQPEDRKDLKTVPLAVQDLLPAL
jgi:hypothetical protein